MNLYSQLSSELTEGRDSFWSLGAWFNVWHIVGNQKMFYELKIAAFFSLHEKLCSWLLLKWSRTNVQVNNSCLWSGLLHWPPDHVLQQSIDSLYLDSHEHIKCNRSKTKYFSFPLKPLFSLGAKSYNTGQKTRVLLHYFHSLTPLIINSFLSKHFEELLKGKFWFSWFGLWPGNGYFLQALHLIQHI